MRTIELNGIGLVKEETEITRRFGEERKITIKFNEEMVRKREEWCDKR